MSENEMLKEQFNEEMFERRANGIPTESFSVWKKKKEKLRAMFDYLSAENERGIRI